jgi:hypothetical protein
MNPLDLMLIKAIASNPDEVMRQLLSPQTGWEEGWIQTPTVKNICRQMARMALAGQNISWLSLMSAVTLDDTSLDTIKQAWKEGRAERPDWHPIVDRLKNEKIKRDSDASIKTYYGRTRETPDRIRDHLGVLGLELSVIANDGKSYDPTPSAHLDDKHIEVVTSWGWPVLDDIFGGGILSHGFVVWTAPSGCGKTTMGRTLAAYAIPQNKRIVIMSNEMAAGSYADGILRALRRRWMGERQETDLIKDMDSYMSIYDQVYTFEKVRQILYWERPDIAVLDSINAVSPPDMARKMSEHEQHRAKADMTLSMVNEFETLLYAPGNMSEQEQRRLRGVPDNRGRRTRPEDVNSVMLFGSAAYQNASDLAFVSWRDAVNPDRQMVKRVKKRYGGEIGQIWDLKYDQIGRYYC